MQISELLKIGSVHLILPRFGATKARQQSWELVKMFCSHALVCGLHSDLGRGSNTAAVKRYVFDLLHHERFFDVARVPGRVRFLFQRGHDAI